MNETLSLEDETAILADGPLGGCTCFPQGNLVQLLTDVTSSMSTMSASLHNVAHKQGDNDAESASKRASPSPASGISSHVNDLLHVTEEETGQNKLLNSSKSQDDVLDNIAHGNIALVT